MRIPGASPAGRLPAGQGGTFANAAIVVAVLAGLACGATMSGLNVAQLATLRPQLPAAPLLPHAGSLRAAVTTFPVTFSESGLPGGTRWFTTLAGVQQSSVTPTIVYSEPNGKYNFNVTPIPSWFPMPPNGSVTVSGAAVTVPITFVPAWNVTIHETGLAAGTLWSVTLNSSLVNQAKSSTTTMIRWILPNGSYVFHPESPVRGTPGVQYINGTFNIPVGVKNADTNRSVAYTTQYLLAAAPSPSVGGSVSPPSGWFNASSTVILTATPAAGFAFQSWSGTGRGNYSGTANPATVVMGGPVTEIAIFASAYSVTFVESGLPASTAWSVNVSGTLRTSSATTIVFPEPNGSYSFVVTPIAGYHANTYRGSVTVSGSSQQVPLTWVAFTYIVNITEFGLPAGTLWSFTLNGVTKTSTGSSVLYSSPNGTWPYVVGPIPSYHANTYSGALTVNGANTGLVVVWSLVTYAVTFSETGLVAGTLWTVTLNGVQKSSTVGSIPFTEPNGSFPFSVASAPGYLETPASGSTLVQGSAVNQAVSFSKLYTLTVVENGLPSGSSWGLALGVTLYSSTTTLVTFDEPNGTYSVTPTTQVVGYQARPSTLSLVVNGADASSNVAFIQTVFPVSFTESGLASGTVWSVTLGGVLVSSANATINFHETNGTYAFSVGGVSGFSASPSSGSLQVTGAPVTETVAFTSSSGLFGLSAIELYGLVGVIVVVAAVAVVEALLLYRRRRAAPPASTPPPAGPST